MKLLPLLKFLKYSRKNHARYYRLMPSRMAKYELEIEKLGAEIIFEAEEEDIQVSGHFDNEEMEQEIIDDYNSGNEFAWFCAKVTVKYKGFEATDYLGACSYKDEKDFKKGGYYYDMVTTCVKEINRDIELHNAEVIKNWNIRKAKQLIAPYGLFIVASKELPVI